MKKIIFNLLMWCVLAFGVNTLAFAGICQNVGSPIYPVSVTLNKLSASQNNTGTDYPTGWGAGGGTYSVQCDCTGTGYTDYFGNVWYTATSPLPVSTVNSTYQFAGSDIYPGYQNAQFYKLTNNLDVAMASFIKGGINGGTGGYFGIPFQGVNNQYATLRSSNNLNNGGRNLACKNSTAYANDVVTGFGTGGQGKIVFRITHPFVGVSSFTGVIANIYGSTVNATTTQQAMASVSASINVTVEQDCIMQSSDLAVDFGSIPANAFVNAGTGGSPIPAKPLTFTYNCSNMPEGIKLTLSFQGAQNAIDNTALAAQNAAQVPVDSVGFRFTQVEGTVIPVVPTGSSPNPVPLQYTRGYDNTSSTQNYTVKFNAAPISTNGKAPPVGPLKGIATLHVDIQ